MKRTLVFTGIALVTSGMTFGQKQKVEIFAPQNKVSTVGYSFQEAGLIGDVTKGAPFSAQQTMESTQTLADGTHISRTSSVTIYRDSQGRTRREDPNTISINDTIAGVTYRLNKKSQLGVKAQLLRNSIVTYDGDGGMYSLQLRQQAQAAVDEKVLALRKQLAETEASNSAQVAKEKKLTAEQMKEVETIAAYKNDNETHESLGSQVIEGVAVDGTRTTVVIPTGQIGNDRPISIVTEQWYSPELHITVMSRHSDPRSGETITKYTGIQRVEPDSALFQVPPGYSLREEPMASLKLKKPE